MNSIERYGPIISTLRRVGRAQSIGARCTETAFFSDPRKRVLGVAGQWRQLNRAEPGLVDSPLKQDALARRVALPLSDDDV
jgi:hypothetical protein